jgi:hypothetical protein
MSEKIASHLHLLMCKKNHLKECQWYEEEQIAERWEYPSHKEWLKKADMILAISKITEEQFEGLLRRLYGIIAEITSLKENLPAMAGIIDTLINEAIRTKAIEHKPETKD